MKIKNCALILSCVLLSSLPALAEGDCSQCNCTCQNGCCQGACCQTVQEDVQEEEADTVINSQDLQIVKFLQDAYSFQDVTDVSTIWDNCSDKSDVLVTLYLSKLSETSPIDINMLRRDGLHWSDIIKELEIDSKEILPQFANCSVNESQKDHVVQIVNLQNWLRNKAEYSLYDKTMRNLCAAKLLVDLKGYTPIKAAQTVQMQKDPIDAVYKLFVEKN